MTLVLFCRALTGGIRKHVVSILEEYKNKPHTEVYLVTNLKECDGAFRKLYEKDETLKEITVDLPIRRAPHFSDFKILMQLRKALKPEYSHTVFHGHGAKGGVLARVLGIPFRAKVIYTPHGGSVHPMFGSLKNKIYQFIEWALYYFTDYLVFESQYSLEAYAKRIHKRTDKFKLNYNGILIGEAKLKEQKPATQLTIGCFSALRKLKGLDLLITAAEKLKAENFNFQIRIFGEGQEKENLKALAKEKGVDDITHFLGETADPEREMQACDIVVQPSRFESFGLTACEAMALGIPVIVSDAGGLPEVVEHNSSGLIFQNENPKDLTNQLRRIMTDATLRERMALGGRERVVKLFDEKEMLEGLGQIYSLSGSDTH